MKQFDIMKPGLRMELTMLNENGQWAGGPYVTQLLEPVVDGETYIAAPIYKSTMIALAAGHTVYLTFLDNQKGQLGFLAEVLGNKRENRVRSILVSIKSSLTSKQRRTHYRLPACLEFAYRPHLTSKDRNKSDQTDPEINLPFNFAFTQNVSGAGLGVMLNEELKDNTVIEFELKLDANYSVKGLAQVVRIVPVNNDGLQQYLTGMKITKMPIRDDDHLSRFIFKQQRMLLQKDFLKQEGSTQVE